jgi:CheY-like chemotaxis protein
VIGNSRTPILLVDDRSDGLLTLEAVLKGGAYQLVKASSGKEALELLRQYHFAVILLDVQMPDMDGFETAKQIKQQENGRHVPIIFITAINKEVDHVNRGYISGAVDYIFKPFEPDVLRSKVAVFVDLYRLQRRVEEQSQLLVESERKDREYRIAQLELRNLRRYHGLADAIPHIVMKAKPDGTVDYLNRFWCQYTGLTEEQALGDGWRSSFNMNDLQNFLTQWDRVRVTGENFEVECRIREKSSEERWKRKRTAKLFRGLRRAPIFMN